LRPWNINVSAAFKTRIRIDSPGIDPSHGLGSIPAAENLRLTPDVCSRLLSNQDEGVLAMKIRFLAGVALLVFLMAGHSGHAFQTGMQAPDFQLTSLNDEPVSLARLLDQGSPLLLVFWTTWCPYCKNEMQTLNSLLSESKLSNVAILGINAGWNDSVSRARDFQDRYDIRFDLAFDHDNQVSQDYMIRGVPSLILVDGQGTIAYRGHALSPELKDMIAKLLDH
jgi:peroxiredoxin